MEKKRTTDEASPECCQPATGKILSFDILAELNKGKEHEVKVRIKRNGKYIFLTLMLMNPDKEQIWWVDTKTIDLVLNGG